MTTKIVTRVLSALLDAWFVMLLVGIAHGSDARIPALSYGATFALVLAVSIAATRTDGASK